jgi:hypothetical protein
MSGGDGRPSMATVAHGLGFDTPGRRMLFDSDTVDDVDNWGNRIERDGRVACIVRDPAR